MTTRQKPNPKDRCTNPIVLLPLSTLHLWGEANPNEGDVGAIAASIERFGFNAAVRVWRNNTIIAGNHSTMALMSLKARGPKMAQEKGLLPWPPAHIMQDKSTGEWLVPCIDVSHLDELDAKAYAIADNDIARKAAQNATLKAQYLIQLQQERPESLHATGWDAESLDEFLSELADGYIKNNEDDSPQVDRAEELREKWHTLRGQIWQIGRHRVMCGDSTSADDVDLLLDGVKVDLVFTDPPYNVGKDYGSETNDTMTPEQYAAWSLAWFFVAETNSDAIAFTPGAVNVWMWSQIKRPKWMAIWIKKNQVSRNGAGGYNTYEPILCYGKIKIDYDSWDIPVKQEDVSHPVPKTVEAWLRILSDCLHEGRTIYDPFLGSGTTAVAAEQLGRICYGMEIEPKYVAVTLERMSLAFPNIEITLLDATSAAYAK